MRRAGVLLHPTAIPGPPGMGDLGPSARAWIDQLAASGTRVWQVLPLQPTSASGEPGCPYLSPSAFALEESLVSLDDLVEDNLLERSEIPLFPRDAGRIDFRRVAAHRVPLLHRAAGRVAREPAVAAWRAENPWVASWAAYRAAVRLHGEDWRHWPTALRDAPERAAEHAPADEVAVQFLLARQWSRVSAHARAKGVEIWGDLPIFVDLKSCDVWENRGLWRLGSDLEPVVVSGVPPDLFTEAGQKWGHPLYDVGAHRASGHAWWTRRVSTAITRFATVRIDHFRGLAACWEVPAHDSDARRGTWQPGLGSPLLEAFVSAFGRPLPLFAEDLGVITPDVEALRDAFGLAGMAVLQFGLDGDRANPHHPDNHRENQVVYTGTHDTDTSVGWASTLGERDAANVCAALRCHRGEIADALTRATLGSRARTAMVLGQDLVGLGSESRVNRPGTQEGNWSFRFREFPSDAAWAAWSSRLAAAGRA